MKLKDKLNAIKTKFESTAPPEVLKVMHRVNDDLKHSGILEKILPPGDKAPDFMLPDTNGTIVNLSSILEKGPLVLTFFRGQW
jgi:hypothetical protein